MKNHRFLVRNTSVRTLPPKILRIPYTPPSPSYSQLTGFTQPTSGPRLGGGGGVQGGLSHKYDENRGNKILFCGCSLEFFSPLRGTKSLSSGTLKLEAQPTNACFATVNQMFGGSSQLPTTAERAVIKSLSTVHTTKQCPAVVGI